MIRHKVGTFGLSEEIVRYGAVAITAFIIDVGLFYILAQNAKINYTLAAVIAYGVGTIWSYFLSIRWAFAYRRLAGQIQEPLIFWLIAGGGLAATVVLLNFLSYLGFGIIAAKFITEATIAIISFGSKKILLFTNIQELNEVLRWYKKAPLLVRIHVLIRRWTLPLDLLLRYVPPTSKSILEIGTGYGFVLCVLSQRRSHESPATILAGTDIDEQKLMYARLAASEDADRIEFTMSIPNEPKKWQTVLIIDVLYLLSPNQQKKMINDSLQALTPGGTLLIKEMAYKPAWKFWLLKIQEFMSVSILRITARQASGKFHFINPENLAKQLTKQGYQVGLHRLDSGWLHPHLLLTAQKPGIVKSNR